MNCTVITLNHLPIPTSAGERDLKGLIKIMFQKIAADKVGFEYNYPQLAVASITDDGEVIYQTAPTQVRHQVESAECIRVCPF